MNKKPGEWVSIGTSIENTPIQKPVSRKHMNPTTKSEEKVIQPKTVEEFFLRIQKERLMRWDFEALLAPDIVVYCEKISKLNIIDKDFYPAGIDTVRFGPRE